MKPIVLHGDALEMLRTLPDESVQCCVTSPPYWALRDYGVVGQIGMEKTPEEFVAALVGVFQEVRRVLRNDGTLWMNLGDTYAGGGNGGGGSFAEINRTFRAGCGRADGKVDERGQRNRNGVGQVNGIKPKDMVGIPWMTAFALRAYGWYLRSDIIWHKPNPMPESVTDRPTKAHEYLFLLSKSATYFYDSEAIKEPSEYVGVTGQDANGFKNPRQFNGKLSASKQDGHGGRHAGFNSRWDSAEARGECSTTRNKRSVWTVATNPYPEAHFATYPPDLIKPCILAGSRHGDVILDPFGGSGTTGAVAIELGRKAILIELNGKYLPLIERRCHVTPGLAL